MSAPFPLFLLPSDPEALTCITGVFIDQVGWMYRPHPDMKDWIVMDRNAAHACLVRYGDYPVALLTGDCATQVRASSIIAVEHGTQDS